MEVLIVEVVSLQSFVDISCKAAERQRGEVVTCKKWDPRKRMAGFEMAESCIRVVEVNIIR